MADENNQYHHTSTDDLVSEISRLEKEKEDLEKRNRERQQLEQQLRQLKKNVSTLKTGDSSSPAAGGSGEGRKRQDGSGISADLSTSLEQSQSRLRDIQQSFLPSPPARDRRSVELSESYEEVEDDVMSAEHKQALRANRDVLVENMTPDDIFNDFISKHILTNADVSRIKERNTVEAINEELLNIIVRRSDRAFHVFVSSLRRTLQGWLANRIDPGHIQPRTKRKRRTGELNVDIDCERVSPACKNKPTCTCEEVEKQILVMAKGAFSNIRRRDASASSFEQFKKELQQTNQVIKDSLDLMNSLKTLCRHGDIIDLLEGSVRFTVRCRSFKSCQALWRRYESGELSMTFQRGIITPTLLTICGAKAVVIRVRISKLEYVSCALELGRRLLSKQTRAASLQKQLRRRLRSNKVLCEPSQPEDMPLCREDILSTASRRAFQEIPNNVDTRQTFGQYSGRPTSKMTGGNDLFTTSQDLSRTDISSYKLCSKGRESSYHRSTSAVGLPSVWSKTQQRSPIHKTRYIMRHKHHIDSENLDQSSVFSLKTAKSHPSCKLYNLRVRTADRKGRICQRKFHTTCKL